MDKHWRMDSFLAERGLDHHTEPMAECKVCNARKDKYGRN